MCAVFPFLDFWCLFKLQVPGLFREIIIQSLELQKAASLVNFVFLYQVIVNSL